MFLLKCYNHTTKNKFREIFCNHYILFCSFVFLTVVQVMLLQLTKTIGCHGNRKLPVFMLSHVKSAWPNLMALQHM